MATAKFSSKTPKNVKLIPETELADERRRYLVAMDQMAKLEKTNKFKNNIIFALGGVCVYYITLHHFL